MAPRIWFVNNKLFKIKNTYRSANHKNHIILEFIYESLVIFSVFEDV